MGDIKGLLSTIRAALEQAQKLAYIANHPGEFNYAEAARQAKHVNGCSETAIAALDQLEAQQAEAKPVAWMGDNVQPITAVLRAAYEHAEHPMLLHYDIPLYAHPPQQRGIGKLIEAGDAMFEWIDGAHLDKAVSFTKRAETERGPALEGWNAAKYATAQQQTKRLTDEEIKRIATEQCPSLSHLPVGEHLPHLHGFQRGLRYARDNGYIGGLSVEEVMHCLMGWAQIHYPYISKSSVGSLRKHLTAKLQGR